MQYIVVKKCDLYALFYDLEHNYRKSKRIRDLNECENAFPILFLD